MADDRDGGDPGRALRDSEARFRSLFAQSPLGAQIYAKDGSVQILNDAFFEVWRIPREIEPLILAHYNVLEDEQLARLGVLEHIEAAFRGEARRTERFLFDPSTHVPDWEPGEGEPRGRWVQAMFYPIVDADGVVREVVGVAEDVSDRVELEAQLRHAQKLDAVGRLAGGIAHEFNNLLTAIIGNLELALQGDPAAERDALGSALRAGTRAAALTGQLLAFSRLDDRGLQAVRLDEVARSAVALARQTMDRQIQFQLDVAAVWCAAAPGELDQVLMNLLVNARDAIQERRAGAEESLGEVAWRPEIAVSVAAPGGDGMVRLVVQDNGAGVPAALQDRIFEPFFTTKDIGQGTGLGLAAIYGIVKRLGGALDFESRPGEGSRFEIALPAAAQPESAAPTAPPRAEPGGGERVLVVDDEPAVRSLALAVLSRAGYAPIAAEDLASAREALARDPAIRVALLDQAMPRGSGLELLPELQARGIRCVLSSGHTIAPELTPGVDASLPKPWRPVALLQVIREVLDRG